MPRFEHEARSLLGVDSRLQYFEVVNDKPRVVSVISGGDTHVLEVIPHEFWIDVFGFIFPGRLMSFTACEIAEFILVGLAVSLKIMDVTKVFPAHVQMHCSRVKPLRNTRSLSVAVGAYADVDLMMCCCPTLLSHFSGTFAELTGGSGVFPGTHHRRFGSGGCCCHCLWLVQRPEQYYLEMSYVPVRLRPCYELIEVALRFDKIQRDFNQLFSDDGVISKSVVDSEPTYLIQTVDDHC